MLLARGTHSLLKVLGKKTWIYSPGKDNKLVEKIAFRDSWSSPSEWACKGLPAQHSTAGTPFRVTFPGWLPSPVNTTPAGAQWPAFRELRWIVLGTKLKSSWPWPPQRLLDLLLWTAGWITRSFLPMDPPRVPPPRLPGPPRPSLPFSRLKMSARWPVLGSSDSTLLRHPGQTPYAPNDVTVFTRISGLLKEVNCGRNMNDGLLGEGTRTPTNG